MIRKFLTKLNNLSKKASLIFLMCLSVSVITSLVIFITGLILYTSDLVPTPSYSLPLIITGSVLIFIELIIILLFAIASNFSSSSTDNKKI